MHLVTLDRLPVEGNVLLFWSVLGLAGGLNIALTAEIANGSSDMIFLLVPSVAFLTAAFAFALELTLSLVRLIKTAALRGSAGASALSAGAGAVCGRVRES